MEQVFDRQLPEFAIGHEFSEDLLITLDAIDDEALEGFFEDVAEVVLGIRGGGFLQYLAFDSFLLNLVEEELVGLGKVRAEALVQDVNEFGERDLRVFLACAHVIGAFERFTVACAEVDLAFADRLQAVVLQLHFFFEVVARPRVQFWQLGKQEAQVSVELLQVGILVRYGQGARGLSRLRHR